MKTGKTATQPKLDWDLVEKKCDAIGKLANLPSLFQTIKNHLEEKTSFIFFNHEGFLVVRPRAKTLQVEVAYCSSGKGYLKYQESIERLARFLECTQIEFYTVRKGFDRLAKKLGYSQVPCEQNFTLWRKKL